MKVINISVDLEGNIKTDLEGFKGKECIEKMKPFEEGLGAVKKRQTKSEYHQTNTTAAKQTV